MRLLIIHNEYSVYGGEDAVVNKFYSSLAQSGIDVKLYKVNNSSLSDLNMFGKVALFVKNFAMRSINQDLLSLLDNYKPDIVHIHNVYPLIAPRIYYEAYIRKIKIVQTLHNYRFMCPNGLLFRKGMICERCSNTSNLYYCFYKRCYRNSYLQSFWYAFMISKAYKKGWFQYIDKFIALNPFMLSKMIEYGYKKSKLTIIPNGLSKPEKIESIEKKNYFLYIGRLSEEKGIMTLINAINKTDFQLIVIGKGPLEQKILSLIKEKSNIQLLGFKTGEEKDRLIAEAKAVVVPSECYENFPTVVIEAFSHGVPVIASKIGGLQYMVKENYNGYTFEAGKEMELAEKINLLFQDNTYDKLTIGALTSYNENYNENIIIKKNINLYRELIENTSSIPEKNI